MAVVSTKRAYRVEPIDTGHSDDSYARVYEKDGWLLGYVKQNDVIVSADLDNNTQKTVKRWFAYVDEEVEFAWETDEHLRDVTGYATREDAINALITGEWTKQDDGGPTPNEEAVLEKAVMGESLTVDEHELLENAKQRLGDLLS